MNIQQLTPDEEINIRKTSKSIPEFNLQGHIKVCKVVSVYDGDTIKVCFYHNNIINKWNIRLLGLDTPELRPSRKLVNRDDEIKKGKDSRDYLKSILLTPDENNQPKLFYLKCYDFDKYGRLLGEIFEYNPILLSDSSDKDTNFNNNIFDINQTGGNQTNYPGLHNNSINTLMIRQGHAKYYDGGKK